MRVTASIDTLMVGAAHGTRKYCEGYPGQIDAAMFRIEDEAKISFWDALICASAIKASATKAGAAKLPSEDPNAGQSIAGILVEIRLVAGDEEKARCGSLSPLRRDDAAASVEMTLPSEWASGVRC